MDPADLILELLGRAENVALGMRELVDACGAATPHADWALVRELDWQADQERVARWFGALVTADPPGPASVADLYFGLHNPCGPDGQASAAMHVIGYARARSWPGKKIWLPARGRADGALFAQLHKIAYRGKRCLGNDLEHAILLGYDSGDIVKIGSVTEDGLELDAGWS
jgi:hypothetical protein